VKCNEIFRAHRGTRRQALGVGSLTLVQLAHGVFDMLAQQTAFFGRHVTVAATLIEIGGNCGTHHDV